MSEILVDDYIVTELFIHERPRYRVSVNVPGKVNLRVGCSEWYFKNNFVFWFLMSKKFKIVEENKMNKMKWPCLIEQKSVLCLELNDDKKYKIRYLFSLFFLVFLLIFTEILYYWYYFVFKILIWLILSWIRNSKRYVWFEHLII